MVHIVRGLYTIMICMVLFNVHSRVGRKLYTVLGLGLGLGYIQFHKRLPETTSHLYTMFKQLGWQSVVRRSKGQLLRAHVRARSSWRPTWAGHSRRKWRMVSGTPHPSQFPEACLPQR